MMACNQCEDLVKTCSEWQVDDNSTTQARPEALVFAVRNIAGTEKVAQDGAPPAVRLGVD
jgi:hypothetical protein